MQAGRVFLLVGTLLALTPSVASAQGLPGPFGERERGEKACRGDVGKLCRKVMDQGENAVLACLQQNVGKLSRACRQVLQDNRQL